MTNIKEINYENYGSLKVTKTVNPNGGTINTSASFRFTAKFDFPKEFLKTFLKSVF